MIYILQAEQQGLDQKMHTCNKFSGLRWTFRADAESQEMFMWQVGR